MKYCNFCKRLSAGEPLFCEHCQHTYNVRLCPHRHENPRSAVYCGTCGSNDLSAPAPERSVLAAALIYTLPKFGALLLLLVSLYVFFGILDAILTNQQLSGQLVSVVLVLALAWWLYLRVA